MIASQIVDKLAEIHEWASNSLIFANANEFETLLVVDSYGKASIECLLHNTGSFITIFIFPDNCESTIEKFLNTSPEKLYNEPIS